MKKINILLIGLGPHSRRIYFPAIQELDNVEITTVVELESAKQNTQEYLETRNSSAKLITTKKFDKLPGTLKNKLDEIIIKNEIKGVIIATEPLMHKEYALWALKNGLNILMDKPLTTYEGILHDVTKAQQLYKDYMELLEIYRNNPNNTCFIVNVQRRYHPGFKYVLEQILEVRDKTGCPVTSIQATHCDGQWRLPKEIISQNYHPYNSGYGKISHSGYHIIDMVAQYIKTGYVPSKRPEDLEVYSQYVDPKGFIKQINRSDYIKLFGNSYTQYNKYSDAELEILYEGFGEVDSTNSIRLLKDNINVCNISINLMHNGFARRNWVLPGKDLYKGNGRVKHEYHNIEQGPFQNIQVHSYQSKDKHGTCDETDFDIGGNNHFDIYIYRNKDILSEKDVLRKVSLRDLINEKNYNTKKLAIEEIKKTVVKEFEYYMRGLISRNELTSNIYSHSLGVKLMSSMYEASCKGNVTRGHLTTHDYYLPPKLLQTSRKSSI